MRANANVRALLYAGHKGWQRWKVGRRSWSSLQRHGARTAITPDLAVCTVLRGQLSLWGLQHASCMQKCALAVHMHMHTDRGGPVADCHQAGTPGVSGRGG